MKKLILVGLLTSTLIGCDGETNSSGSKYSLTDEYPVAKALENITKQGYPNSTIELSKDGVQIITRQYAELQYESYFNGGGAERVDIKEKVEIDGTLMRTVTESRYFTESPFRLLGFIQSGGELRSYVVAHGNLPNRAKVGSKGNFYTIDIYKGAGKTDKKGTEKAVWSLDSKGYDAELCVNILEHTTSYREDDFASSECYTIDKKGNLLSVRATSSDIDASRDRDPLWYD